MRDIRNLNKNWQFIKNDIGTAAAYRGETNAAWEAVELPHTWNAYDGANGFDYYKGACWYRKEILLRQDDAGKRVFVEFEGANSVADVYMNDKYLGQHKGGYSTFRFDVTLFLNGSVNVLTVKLDNTVVDDVYPQMADFTFFGGLYRDVNLVVVDPIHLELLDYGSQGVYMFQDAVSKEKAEITAKILVKNDQIDAAAVRLWVDLVDADGIVQSYAAKEVSLEAGEAKKVFVPLTLAEPILWHGQKNPYMYTAKVTVQNFNDTVDNVEVPVGLRYFKVDPEVGFFLNGEYIQLHGVSRHQDRKDMGWAITQKEQDEDMALIKEVGAKSIRLAHYQHNQYFYDLCDREGMVVWAEIPFISIMSKTELEGINAKSQMTELIRQNFNHPSIIFWGIQNEIQISGERADVRRLCGELNELTKQEDPTRLTTMANVMFVPDDDAYNQMTDIVGYNKYYGWYNGQAEDFEPWLDGFHKTNPNVALGISEYGAEGIVRYHSETPKVKDYSEEYHALYHETVWNIFKDRKYLWATYVWNMFDFGANIRDEGGVKGRNNKGLVTYDRKVKKDAFYMYKAHWSDEKFVHIASKRFIERAQEAINIKVYTNCDTVTFYINGEFVEAKSGAGPIVVFESVKLQAGANNISVTATESGSEAVYLDKAYFELVAVSNPAYEAPEAEGGIVANWFDMPDDLEDVQIEELVIPEGAISTASSLSTIMENDEAKKVIVKYLGNIEEQPMYGMMQSMSINQLSELDSETFSEKMKFIINRDLLAVCS